MGFRVWLLGLGFFLSSAADLAESDGTLENFWAVFAFGTIDRVDYEVTVPTSPGGPAPLVGSTGQLELRRFRDRPTRDR